MPLVIGPDSGPTYPPLVDAGSPPPVFPDFSPLFPPPVLGSGTPPFPPGVWAPPPLPSFTVPPAVGPDSGPSYPPLNDLGTNPIIWPDFSTIFVLLTVSGFMNWGPPPMITTTQNVILDGWGPFAPPV